MAFEKVNPQTLEASVNICRNAIKYNESQKSINAISSSRIWQADAKDNLQKALDKLINTKYKKILNYLETLSTSADLISDYKELVEDNDECSREINNLEPKLYYKKKKTVISYNSDGEEIMTVKTYTVKDKTVESRINSLKEKIKQNKENMKSIESKVSALID